MQVNLLNSRGTFTQIKFKGNSGDCGTQKGINFDKIASINVSSDSNNKDIVKSIPKPLINRHENPMIEYQEKPVDFDKLDEVFQKFSSSSMSYSKNTPQNYPKKSNKGSLKNIEINPPGIQSNIEAKHFSQNQVSQKNHKINFMTNKIVSPCPPQVDNKMQLKQISKINQIINKKYESPTKIVIPLMNINEIQETSLFNLSNNDKELNQKGVNNNNNQLLKLSSKEDLNLNCINTGNSSSKDENNPNRLSRKVSNKS